MSNRPLPLFITYRREQLSRLFRLVRPFCLYGLLTLALLSAAEISIWEAAALAYFKLPSAVSLSLTLLGFYAKPGWLRRNLSKVHCGNLAVVSCAAALQLWYAYWAAGPDSMLFTLAMVEEVAGIFCLLMFGYPYRRAAAVIAGLPFAVAFGVSLVTAGVSDGQWVSLLYPVPAVFIVQLLGRVHEKISFNEYRMRHAADRRREKLQEELTREEMHIRQLQETRKRLEEEIEERKKVEQGLERIAAFDELTSVYNRRAGMEVLKEALHYTKRNKLYLSVVFLDIDKLKYVNDNYGHKAGDDYLKEVVHTLRLHLRKSDSICRFGGDEFVVVLTECRRQKAIEIINGVEETLSGKESRWGLEDLSFSYGTAQAAPDDQTASIEQLIAEADKHMYIQKQQKKRR